MFKPGLRPQEAKVACDLGGAAQTKSSGKGSGLKRRVLFVSASLLAVAGMGLGAIQISSGARIAGATSRPAEVTNVSKFAVVINHPPGPPQVATGQTNFHGQPVFASCVACHTTTKPNLESRRTEDLDQFHQGLKYHHGNLTCLSCHNSTDYDTLRLADTRAVEFSDSMTLCSQCHGPQRRDYDRGLHGGMNGHWDLARGGRTRNTCVDCHDPHTPAFPLVLPVLPPRDRVSVQKQISPDASH